MFFLILEKKTIIQTRLSSYALKTILEEILKYWNNTIS